MQFDIIAQSTKINKTKYHVYKPVMGEDVADNIIKVLTCESKGRGGI